MATLHKVTEETKTLLKIITGFLVVLLLLGVFIRVGNNIKEVFFPTPPPPPTVLFGKLPAPLPTPQPNQKGLTYTINTIPGTLPSFPGQIAVYPFVVSSPNLLALQRAQEKVRKYGFTGSPRALSALEYAWITDIPFEEKLIYNIQTLNFTLSSDFLTDATILSQKNGIDEQNFVEKARDFLSGMSTFPEDIDTEKTKVTLFKVENQQLIPVEKKVDANIVRVDFFEKNLNNLPLYYTNPFFSSLSVLFTRDTAITEAQFFYNPIQKDIASTYPIKTADEALKELQKGNGYLASYNGIDKNISIKDVFLAYYRGDTEQGYLLPIIVFQGEGGFFAYVSAIKNEWITTEEITP